MVVRAAKWSSTMRIRAGILGRLAGKRRDPALREQASYTPSPVLVCTYGIARMDSYLQDRPVFSIFTQDRPVFFDIYFGIIYTMW